jgi:hypothetical protein
MSKPTLVTDENDGTHPLTLLRYVLTVERRLGTVYIRLVLG